jgi:hypothetical protein
MSRQASLSGVIRPLPAARGSVPRSAQACTKARRRAPKRAVVHQSALSCTKEALSCTKEALSCTKEALSCTKEALSCTKEALSCAKARRRAPRRRCRASRGAVALQGRDSHAGIIHTG